MVLAVAATFESFATARMIADEILRRIVNSLDVILKIVRSIRGERALGALLALQILVRQLVLTQQKFGQISLGALVALEPLFLEWIFIAMHHRAVLSKARNVAESLIAVLTLMLSAPRMALQMRLESQLGVQDVSTLVAFKRNVRLFWYVRRSQWTLGDDQRKLALDYASTGAGVGFHLGFWLLVFKLVIKSISDDDRWRFLR